MRTFRNTILATVLAAGAAFGATALAAPPTDAQIEAYIASVQAAQKSTEDRQASAAAMAEAGNAGLKDLSIEEASLAQLRMLDTARLPMALPTLRAAAAPRLQKLAEAPGIDGLRALFMSATWYPDPAERTPEARQTRDKAIAEIYLRCARHPALGELLASDTEGPDFISRYSRTPAAAAKAAGLPQAAPALLDNKMSPIAAARCAGLFDMIPDDAENAALRQSVRAKALVKVEEGLAAASKAEADSALAKAKPGLERARGYLDSSFAKGELMNNTAPAITFNWCTDEKIKSLADLKGRVVVVDFWATWCGPCIGSFPNVRELQKRYEGYPVTILGVTSIQGSHSNPKTRERTETKDDPAKEKELMTGFIKDMEVTWTVGFSDQEVFNPAYGVRGIPHVAIVDAAGKVRHNGLHPGGSLPEKAKKIDALLKEAGLPFPEPMPEEEKKEGQ